MKSKSLFGGVYYFFMTNCSVLLLCTVDYQLLLKNVSILSLSDILKGKTNSRPNSSRSEWRQTRDLAKISRHRVVGSLSRNIIFTEIYNMRKYFKVVLFFETRRSAAIFRLFTCVY